MLKVSGNKRFLVHGDGRPFFYLGDTAWELFHRADREEADVYLADRAARKFTVIQAVVLAEFDGLHVPNAYGETPLVGDDPLRPNEAYFRHVDYIVEKANALGLHVGMLPTWGDKYNKMWGIGPEIFTAENALGYGKWLAERYRNRDIIWILGGDRPLLAEHLLLVRAMAKGIREAVGNTQLITFHPCGGESSSTYVHAEAWLDFHMTQSGHARDRDNYNLMERDYRRLPTRPVMDGEPGYEDHPNAFNPEKGWIDQHDVRKSFYWSVFAGACGYTYGCHDIWQMLKEGRPAVTLARTPWKEALNLPGARQVQYGRMLVESRPYLTRVPDQAVVSSPIVEGGDHVRATRCSEGSYAMVYIPSGQRVTVRMTKIAGSAVSAWWYNPRDGKATAAGRFENSGEREFYTPNWDQSGRDWVLVLDDAARGFAMPGAGG